MTEDVTSELRWKRVMRGRGGMSGGETEEGQECEWEERDKCMCTTMSSGVYLLHQTEVVGGKEERRENR